MDGFFASQASGSGGRRASLSGGMKVDSLSVSFCWTMGPGPAPSSVKVMSESGVVGWCCARLIVSGFGRREDRAGIGGSGLFIRKLMWAWSGGMKRDMIL